MRNCQVVASALSAFGITVSAAVAQWGQIQTVNPPTERSDPLLFYDLFNTRTLMFGGNVTNEFWSLSGGAWTQLTPAVLPGARRYQAISTDTLTGEVWMYGGQDTSSSNALDETWLWNGSAWQLLAPANSAGGHAFHGMAYDMARGVSVVFGGRRNLFNPNQVLSETWEFASGTWTQRFPVTSPPALLDPAVSYHPALGQVMLFGGEDANGQGSDRTWLFDGTDWTEINTTGVRPSPRTQARLVPILSRNIAVLFGGRDAVTFDILNDTWEHDGTSWRQVTNVYGGIYPPRSNFGVAHDLVRDRIVAFGGKTANQALRNDTWEYGAQWQPYGNGCAGSAGVPVFTGVDLPRLGATATATIDNVPPAIPFAFVAVGLSRTQWAFGSLPALLTGFGMPGCRTYTSADLLAYAPATAGVATWSWNVPLQPLFVGEPFYLQGITFDPGINALGLAVSNASTLVIGW